jgi:hypothetical protein
MAAPRPIAEALAGGKFADSGPGKFNLKNALGKTVLGRVVHADRDDGSKRAALESIIPLPKGMVAPPLVGEIFYFNSAESDPAMLENFPAWAQWARKKILESKAYGKPAVDGPKRSTAEIIGDDFPENLGGAPTFTDGAPTPF